MTFAEPTWLYAAAALAAALVAAGLLGASLAGRRLANFADEAQWGRLRAGVQAWRRTARGLLLALAVLLTGAALARPQWGTVLEERKARGLDLVFALDVSKSMLAEDLGTSRLERAKADIRDFVGQLRGDRVGLVLFAGAAFLQIPLTFDHATFTQALDLATPAALPRGGTDLAAALREGAAAFEHDQNFKLLILLSDGEDLGGGALEAAREVAAQKVRVFTVGVGTAAGDLIPLKEDGRLQGFVRDAGGQQVTSRLDEAALTAVAAATGGFYTPLGLTGEGLRRIYDEGLGAIPRSEREGRLAEVPAEQFTWAVVAAFVLLALEYLLSRRTRARPLPAGAAALLALAAAAALPSPAPAQRPADRALALSEAGDHAAAAPLWREAAEAAPEDARAHYNHGVALLRTGDLDAAQAALRQALKTDDLALQADAYYQLGNLAFRRAEAGWTAPETGPQPDLKGKIERAEDGFREAVREFDAALGLQPADAAATANKAAAERWLAFLEELKKQAEPPPQEGGEGEQEPADDQQGEQGEQGQQDQQQGGDAQPSEGQQSEGEQGQQGQQSEGQQTESQQAQGQQVQPDQTGGQEQTGQQGQPGEPPPQEASAGEAPQPGEDEAQATPPPKQPNEDGAEAPQEAAAPSQPGETPKEGEEPPPMRVAQPPNGPDGQPPGEAKPAEASAGEPGKPMTAEEAARALDPLRRQERLLPLVVPQRGPRNPNQDW